MSFIRNRRQQFLTESNFHGSKALTLDVIQIQKNNLSISQGTDEGWHLSMWFGIAEGTLSNFILSYTAGELLEILRFALENVVVAYEDYLNAFIENSGDPNEMAFPVRSYDGYCPYLWLISLCYLLHRNDLLPRVARLVDGEDRENAGIDFNIEDFLNYSEDLERFETDDCVLGCYSDLADAMCESSEENALKMLNKFLKIWYKDLAAAPWHDSHLSDDGYFGYWAFEARVAVFC